MTENTKHKLTLLAIAAITVISTLVALACFEVIQNEIIMQAWRSR